MYHNDYYNGEHLETIFASQSADSARLQEWIEDGGTIEGWYEDRPEDPSPPDECDH